MDLEWLMTGLSLFCQVEASMSVLRIVIAVLLAQFIPVVNK